MLLSVAPLGVFNLTASAETFTEGDFEYRIYGCDAAITKYIGEDTNIIIPDIIGGYLVTKIDAWAFENCTFISSCTIGENIIYIDGATFKGCTSLKTIIFNAKNCLALDSYDDWGNRRYAFEGCSNLTSIIIGKNVNKIPANAFVGTAYYNNSANWNDGVLYIGDYLIKAKSDIKTCSIKNGTRTIAACAFENCNKLRRIASQIV